MVDRAKKLTELPSAATATNNDIFIIVANTAGIATTKQITVNNFKSAFSSVVVPQANTTTYGTVKIGDNLAVNASGFLNANLSYGNSSAHGVVAAGNNVYINANGYLGVFAGNSSVAGVVAAGNNVYINANGYLGVVGANTTVRGVVQVGNNLVTDANAVISVSDDLAIANVQVSSNLVVNGESVFLGESYFGKVGANNAAVLIHINGTLHSNLIPHTADNYQIGNTTQYWNSLYVNGFTVANGAAAPATSSSAGVKGQFAFDSSYVYICVANNTWKRAALSTW
jgi:hypothetical protein